MIMGKLDIRTIYIIFASAFLVNPVLLQDITTDSTSQSNSQVPPSTTMAITTTIVTTPSTKSATITTTESTTPPMATSPTTTTPLVTTPMPTSPLTTTPLATTTQPTTTTTTATTTTAVPIGLGKNCSSSPGSCESSDSNSTCIEDECQCKDGFFILDNTCEPLPKPPGCPPNRNDYNAPNITITWNQTTGADEYGVKFESRTLFKVKTAMAEIDNLVPGRNYNLILKTYMHNKTSDEVSCVIRTESEVPDPPNNVTIVGTLGKDNLNISITAPDELRGDIAGYRIFIYGKSYMDEKFAYRNSIIITDTMDNIYQVTGLQAGTFYNFQVYTVNDAFNSSTSTNLKDLRTLEGEPGQVSSFNKSTARDSFKIEFQRPKKPNGDIIQYVIVVNGPQVCKEYRLYIENISFFGNQSCDGDPSTSQIQLNQKKMKLNVTELSPFVEYTVNIWAYTTEGQGALLPETVMTAISAPYMPRNVIATAVTSTSVRVEWETPQNKTGPTNYTVTAFNEIDKRDVKSTSCNTHRFNDTMCVVGKLDEFWKYSFHVTAKVEKWTSKPEVSKVITTLPGKPGKPIGLSAPLEDEGCKVTLSWFTPNLKDRNANITMYRIQIYSPTQEFILQQTKMCSR